MRIQRDKKMSKTLALYTNWFGYKKPYQVLVDGTFCQTALQNRFSIREQLQNYLQTELKVLTTQCIILEVEKLGPSLTGTATLVKQFPIHKCGHESKPIAGSNCMKQMIGKSRYIIATQDRTLQQFLRQIPGQALLYLHRTTPVLDPPSKKTKHFILKKSNNAFKQSDSIKTVRSLRNKYILNKGTEKMHRKKSNERNKMSSCSNKTISS